MHPEETIGVKLEAKGAERANQLLEKFAKAQDRIEKAITRSSIATEKAAIKAKAALEKQAKAAQDAAEKARKAAEAARKADPLNLKSLLGGSQKTAEAVTSQLQSMGQSMLSQIPIIGQFTGALGGVAGGALAAAGGIAVLVAAIGAAIGIWGKLGLAGIRAQDTLNAFGNQVAALGDPTGVLAKLRAQTRGTVGDLELMRLSVQALRGTDATFRKIVGDQLGTVIDSTTRIARATGENAEIIREKFLSGLRLQSKLKLDDVGVTVKAEQANERYAKSIGKTAGALTELEKRAAFAQEAIRQLNEIGKGFGANEGAEAIERIKASVQNIFTRGSLIAKESFEPVIVGISQIIAKVEEFHLRIAPVLREVSRAFIEVGKAVFAVTKTFLKFTIGPHITILKELFPYIAAVAVLAARALKTFALVVQQALMALDVIGPVKTNFEKNVKAFIKGAAVSLAFGGAFIIGAFAGGIYRGGEVVLRAVTFIAKIVADFLQGFSPPKKGPLSHIDEGGYNVAKAWAEGFMGGMIPTFEETLAYVDARLGDIGKMSLGQVEARLLQLDLALRPFEESLSIVKADMEAIAGFVDPALKVAERQRDKAIKAFGLGKGGDINQLRLFDTRIDQLNQINDLAEEQKDKAELTLAFAKAQQAQERALLNIQKNRLGKPADGSDAATDTPGAGETPPEEGVDNPFTPGIPPDLVGGLGPDIEAAIAAITGAAQAGWKAGLGGADTAFADAQKGLLEQSRRINEANPAAKLAKKMEGIRETLTKPFDDAKKELDKIIPEIFGDEGLIGKHLGEGSAFDRILGEGGSFRTAFNGALTFLNTTFKPTFSTALDDTFGPMGRFGQRLGTTSSFYLMLTGEGGAFKTAFKTANTWLGSDFKTNFSTTLDTIFGAADSAMNTALGLASGFYTMLTSDSGSFRTAWAGANTYLSDTFKPDFELNMLDIFGIENSVMFGAVYSAAELIGRIGLSFKGLIEYINQQAAPQFGQAFGRMISLITAPINAIVALIDTIKNAVNDAIGKLNEVVAIANDPGSVAGGIIGGVSAATGVNIPNPFGGGKAAGGLNLPPAMYKVGERGAEWIQTSGPTNVFPNRFIKALDSLVSMVSAAPSPSMNNVTNNNQRTSNLGGVTIQVGSQREAMLTKQQIIAKYGG